MSGFNYEKCVGLLEKTKAAKEKYDALAWEKVTAGKHIKELSKATDDARDAEDIETALALDSERSAAEKKYVKQTETTQKAKDEYAEARAELVKAAEGYREEFSLQFEEALRKYEIMKRELFDCFERLVSLQNECLTLTNDMKETGCNHYVLADLPKFPLLQSVPDYMRKIKRCPDVAAFISAGYMAANDSRINTIIVDREPWTSAKESAGAELENSSIIHIFIPEW